MGFGNLLSLMHCTCTVYYLSSLLLREFPRHFDWLKKKDIYSQGLGGGMAQYVKCLLCKHKDLSSVPRTLEHKIPKYNSMLL